MKLESGEKAKVTIPVSQLTFSTVAVLVHEDGTEEIVRKCAHGETGVTLSVEHGAVVKIMEHNRAFTDISGHWAKDSIAFVTSRELHDGTSATTFRPDAGMTRGMLAVVLHNLERNPASKGQAAFSDVQEDAWYANAIRWAAEKEIVSGYENGRFDPDAQISREQLAVMLYRYPGLPVCYETALHFQNAEEVSAYAQTAVCWAVEHGILNGTVSGTLNPKGTATRAQVATMLMRYVEAIG